MKLILVREHNGKYRESDLIYENEFIRFKADLGYLQVRNAISNYSFYTIVELKVDNGNQIILCTTPILKIEDWKDSIFRVGEFLIDHYDKTPLTLMANSWTFQQFDQDPIKHQKADKIVGRYDCSLFSSKIFIDESLQDNYISFFFEGHTEE